MLGGNVKQYLIADIVFFSLWGVALNMPVSCGVIVSGVSWNFSEKMESLHNLILK
jgi:hypothetical protein